MSLAIFSIEQKQYPVVLTEVITWDMVQPCDSQDYKNNSTNRAIKYRR